MNNYSNIYKDILKKVYNLGIESYPRGLRIKEKLFGKFKYSPTQCIADFEGKEYNFRYLYGELLRYFSGIRETSFISQFASLRSKIKGEDGLINSNYGNLVFYKLNKYGVSQYNRCLNSLINDKDSRQAIIHYNSLDHQIEGVKDFPCTLYQQFFIRDDILYGITNMRSNDLFYGTNYDVVRFSLVMQSLYIDLVNIYPNLIIGDMNHIGNSLHIYEKDFEKTIKILSSNNNIDYTINLEKSIPEIIGEYFDYLSYDTNTQTNKEYIENIQKMSINIKKV